MLVSVGVGVFVNVLGVTMIVFMAVFVIVVMSVEVLMFVIAFHGALLFSCCGVMNADMVYVLKVRLRPNIVNSVAYLTY